MCIAHRLNSQVLCGASNGLAKTFLMWCFCCERAFTSSPAALVTQKLRVFGRKMATFCYQNDKTSLSHCGVTYSVFEFYEFVAGLMQNIRKWLCHHFSIDCSFFKRLFLNIESASQSVLMCVFFQNSNSCAIHTWTSVSIAIIALLSLMLFQSDWIFIQSRTPFVNPRDENFLFGKNNIPNNFSLILILLKTDQKRRNKSQP